MDNSCKYITKPRSNIKIGDLNIPITITTRLKKPTNYNSPEIILDEETYASCFAMFVSVNGEDIFNGNNLLGKITHHIYIRRNPSKTIKREHYVISRGQAYLIGEVMDNIHMENQFTMLKCIHSGSSNLNVNKL